MLPNLKQNTKEQKRVQFSIAGYCAQPLKSSHNTELSLIYTVLYCCEMNDSCGLLLDTTVEMEL
jgi:hypothetical protein